MKVKGGGESWLKVQHSENEDHGSGPTTSWEIDGETVETVADFIFLGSKITADGDCSHEIKRCLLGLMSLASTCHHKTSAEVRTGS